MSAKQESKFLSGKITGTVASIGDGGNLITDISVAQVNDIPRDESLTVKFGDHMTVGLFPAGHDQPASTMVASLAESGFIEIEIVGISLCEMLGIDTGVPVEISW